MDGDTIRQWVYETFRQIEETQLESAIGVTKLNIEDRRINFLGNYLSDAIAKNPCQDLSQLKLSAMEKWKTTLWGIKKAHKDNTLKLKNIYSRHISQYATSSRQKAIRTGKVLAPYKP